MKTLGRKLRELRLTKGLTQAEVAKAINVDVSTVRNLEKDRTGNDTILRIVKLLATLDCDVQDFNEYIKAKTDV